MPLYDSFVARLKCWNCGIVSLPELQTSTLEKPALRDLGLGDKAELKPVTDKAAFSTDIVFKQPDTPGYCNFMMGWTCPSCKLVNWALVSIQENAVAAIEPLRLDTISLDRVHVLRVDRQARRHGIGIDGLRQGARVCGRHGQPEQQAVGHAGVGLGMLDGHEAIVAPPQVDTPPGQRVAHPLAQLAVEGHGR
jgi:hypothetical protein